MSTPEDLKTTAVDDAQLDEVPGGRVIFQIMSMEPQTAPEEIKETTDEAKLGWNVTSSIK